MCLWVRAMHKYHFVSKAVAPKRVCMSGNHFYKALNVEGKS